MLYWTYKNDGTCSCYGNESVCNWCDQEFDLNNFWAVGTSGTFYVCDKCKNERERQWKEEGRFLSYLHPSNVRHMGLSQIDVWKKMNEELK